MNTPLYSDVMLSPEPQDYAMAIRRKNYLSVLRQVTPPGRFLEIGPGNGEMLPVAIETGFSGIEIADIDAGVVERIKAWYPEIKAHLVPDDEPLSFTLGANSFSCIVACHVLEHVQQDNRLPMLRDCLKMLLPGGYLVLELPNPLCPLGGWSNYLADPTHQLPLSSTGLTKLLLLAGFDTVIAESVKPSLSMRRIPGLLRWLMSLSLGILLNMLGNSTDIRSPAFFVVARRRA